MICNLGTIAANAIVQMQMAICLDPSPGGSAKPITLRDKRPAYGSNSWLPGHRLVSVDVDRRSMTRWSCR
jgi:hypothetical protein